MTSYYDRYWKFYTNIKLGDFHYKFPAIKRFLPVDQNITILDYGCGKGAFTRILKKSNSQSNVTGVDVSEYAINTAKTKSVDINYQTVSDGGRIPLKNSSVDYILCLDVIEHVYNTEVLIKEFSRILKPEGQLLITTPYHGLIKNLVIVLTSFNFIFDPVGPHIRFFTKSSLLNLLNKFNLSATKIGYFGRFYPLSRGMLVFVQKKKHRENNRSV